MELLRFHFCPLQYFSTQITYVKPDFILSRTAAPFARVTQPNKNNLKKGIQEFRIQNDSTNGVFNVTNEEGIVFVQNIELLLYIGNTAM